MGTFIVSAKYLKTKEEDMELRDSRDLGNVANINQKWVYKRQGIVAESIFRVVEYTSGKTLLQVNDDTEILCNEPFEEVYEKWSRALTDYETELDEDEEINHSDGNNSDEDDE